MYSIKNVVDTLEQMAPSRLAEGWDNVGLLIGSQKQPVDKVLCALDLNEEVLAEAIDTGASCIVTHHPFLFSPLKRIELDSPKGRMIGKLIKHDIAVYAMHTNLDIVAGGINDVLCEKFGISNTNILHVTESEPLVKLCVYVPESHSEVVRAEMIKYNNHCIGNYTGCTFTSKGEGTFIPLEGSDPYIGQYMTLEKVQETKLECMVKKSDLSSLCDSIAKVHPYEEIAYDVFELKNMRHEQGLGRYGTIQLTTVAAFGALIKQQLGIEKIRVIGDLERHIEKVAICSGSGSSFINDAAKVADIYITGDMKFHEAQEVLEKGLCAIDMGHYSSENLMMPVLAQRLQQYLPELEVLVSQVNGELFQTI